MIKILKRKLDDKSKQPKEDNDDKNSADQNLNENQTNDNCPDKNSDAKKRKDNSLNSKNNMKVLKLRPNFFLGLQVSNTEIHKNVKNLQEKIIHRNPKLHSALVNVSTLHITLAVTHLANQKEIQLLKENLDTWAQNNKNLYFIEPIVLNFSGVNCFNKSVAYVNIQKNKDYEKICNLSKDLNLILSDLGFSTDQKSFTPHLTFLKLSKDYKLLRSKKKFLKDFEFAEECIDFFGKEQIRKLQLLSMDEPKNENGYYKCLHEIKLSDDNYKASEMNHSECCTPIPKPNKNLT